MGILLLSCFGLVGGLVFDHNGRHGEPDFGIDSGASHERFEIQTPELRIRNFGTRFGVRVPAEGQAELHVMAGKLEVIAESTPERVLKLVPDGRDLPKGTLPELRVGGGPQDAGAASFTGDIDEIAVWDRALTPIEIEQQYRSARGSNGNSAAADPSTSR